MFAEISFSHEMFGRLYKSGVDIITCSPKSVRKIISASQFFAVKIPSSSIKIDINK